MSPEEEFLFDCARAWRSPTAVDDAGQLDWDKIIAVGQANRMQVLLHHVLSATDRLDTLPAEARDALREDVARLTQDAARMGDALREYLRRAAEQNLETVVLKGLSLSINVYDNPAMRPGADIDILVRAERVQDSLAVLDAMGFGRWWPNLLDDRYYERHHLHQQRCTQDLRTWFEIHWALDHPYTLLTIDYDAVMDRTTAGELLGEPVRDLSLPDLLLSLAVHLVKHAVYLPSVIGRPDLPRIILADGMLMYYLDVAEVIKRHEAEIDWGLTVELARQWGAVDILGSVLRACREHLEAPVPAWVVDALPVEDPGPVTRRAMHGMADHEVATYRGEEPSRLWEFLVTTNGAFILRPIRLLDVGAYLFPDADFLRRRYGAATAGVAARHFLRAVGEYARNGIDTLYFTWERYRRLKALGESTSLFNRLEVE